MSLKNRVLTAITQGFDICIKASKLGSGSTWPGHIALQLNKNYIKEVLEKSNTKVILIAGTNGKTTTSTLIRHILEKNSHTVFQNAEGANLLNGIASAIIKHLKRGRLEYDTAIFEVDENVLPLALEQIKPSAIILLNLFRDQLDRYGEVNLIADKWLESLKKINQETLLIINGDDPQIKYLGDKTKAKVYRFGVPEKLFTKKTLPHDVDSTYCPSCGAKLTYSGIAFSHLGNYECKKCHFRREKVEDFSNNSVKYPLQGTYNIYNAHAALLGLHNLYSISYKDVIAQMQDFQPAFGRQEKLKYKNRNVVILLSKNPAGFNQSIEIANKLLDKNASVLLVLNDRIPDGRDVSWIWDVEFEDLKANNDTIVSGDRAYDMALRLKYSSVEKPKPHVFEDLGQALEKAVDATPENGTVVVLPTYSAMLEVRSLILGRKLL